MVVAEIGNNHEGDLGLALELVDAAHSAGVDAVKLQTYRTERFVRRSDRDRFDRMRRFELAPEAVGALAAHARERGLLFLSTPLDLESVAVLEPLVDALKIASGDNTFGLLLEAVAATGKPVMMSTGLATLDDVAAAAAYFPRERLALLQCTSAYPAPPGEANLAAISLLRERFGCTVGYSDHVLGIEASVAAAAAGARVLEKHFTLDKQQSEFRDHALSADPDELRVLVRRVREVEAMLGRAVKEPQPSEQDVAFAARRSVVAARDLEAGRTLVPGDLEWLRPADGLPTGAEDELLGRPLRRPLAAGEPLRREDVA